jgi:hypothetical protein
MFRRDCVAGLTAGGLLALSLYGCGRSDQTLSTAPIEHAIAQSILAQRHVHTRVDCPSTVQRKAGFIFKCTARLNVGTYPVLVTETNDNGHVRYENASRLVVLDSTQVERGIRRSILSQRHLRSTVSCPAEVLQQAGVEFTCTATVGGRAYPFAVTEIDADGHVRYVGRR